MSVATMRVLTEPCVSSAAMMCSRCGPSLSGKASSALEFLDLSLDVCFSPLCLTSLQKHCETLSLSPCCKFCRLAEDLSNLCIKTHERAGTFDDGATNSPGHR